MIKAILFDLDDTLYDQLVFYRQAHKSVASYISSENPSIDSRKFYRRSIEILKKNGSDYGRIYNDILNEEGIYSDELLNDLIEHYRNFKPRLRLYSDFKKVFPFLRKRYKLGIITDGIQSVQENKYRSLKLKRSIPLFIIASSLGERYKKPHSLSFKKALKYLRSGSTGTIYVGDNPFKDFEGAKKAKLITVRILRGEYKDQEHDKRDVDYVIKNYSQFLRLLDKL